MTFYKYPDMENSYRARDVEYIQNAIDTGIIPSDIFVATEKIHGCNFQFTFDPITSEIGSGKRTSELLIDEPFYNFQSIWFLYQQKIADFSAWITSKVAEVCSEPIQQIIFYGELYGNGVQKGTKYIEEGGSSPKFALFDVRVVFSGEDNSRWLSWSMVPEVAFFFGIPCVPKIKIGTFAELLSMDTELESVLCASVGNKGVIAEGVVIKPYVAVDTLFSPQGKNGARYMLKQKSEKFSEHKNKKAKLPKSSTLTDEEQQYLDSFMEYIVESRVENVFSKLSITSTKDFSKVSGMFVSDALKDYRKDNGDGILTVWGNISKIATSQAINEHRAFILERIQFILDNQQ